MNYSDAATSKQLANIMERMPPKARKAAQIQITLGADPRAAILKALGR